MITDCHNKRTSRGSDIISHELYNFGYDYSRSTASCHCCSLLFANADEMEQENGLFLRNLELATNY